jgi:hypothetical protein
MDLLLTAELAWMMAIRTENISPTWLASELVFLVLVMVY